MSQQPTPPPSPKPAAGAVRAVLVVGGSRPAAPLVARIEVGLQRPVEVLAPEALDMLAWDGGGKVFVIAMHEPPAVDSIHLASVYRNAQLPIMVVAVFPPGFEILAAAALEEGVDHAVIEDASGHWVHLLRPICARLEKRRQRTSGRTPAEAPSADSLSVLDGRLSRLALSAIDDAVVMTDTEGTIRYVNPAFERITGYAAPEAVGQTPRLLRTQLHDASYYKQMWETIGRGGSWTGLMQNRRKDGGVFDSELTISPVPDADGKVLLYIGVQRDVTQRRMQERELHRLASVAMQNPNPIVELDFTGNASYMNARAVACFPTLSALGLAHPVLEGIWQQVQTFDPGATTAPVLREIEHDGCVWQQLICLEANLKLVRVYFHDITVLRRTEVELREAEAKKDQLFGFVLHDLNKPLAAIIGYGGRIRDAEGAGELVNKRGGLIHDSALRLKKIIEQFLEVDQIVRGQITVAPECIDLRKMLRTIVLMHAENYPARRFLIDGSSVGDTRSSAPLFVVTDSTQMSRILHNLVENAFRYSEAHVQVATSIEPGGIVRVAVWNDGPPIPPAERPRIFTQFFRASVTRDRIGGHGLGLPSCRLLANALRGKLWFECPQPRGGTEFVLDFPSPTSSRPFPVEPLQ